MASQKPLRDEWPRIRKVMVKGVQYYQVDGRPQYKRKSFISLEDARLQAGKWAAVRERYGKAGRFIAEREATKLAEALNILAPYNASIVDAASHYATHLKSQAQLMAGKNVDDAVTGWRDSYQNKDCRGPTRTEISSMAKIFRSAFGNMRLHELKPVELKKWIDEYESTPGKLASARTRANLHTKLVQFLNFAVLHDWLNKNPMDGLDRPDVPAKPVTILTVSETERLLLLADAHERRDILVPYLAVGLFAGLRPSETALLTWKDINFDNGDIHVRAETSKTKEERFVPMELPLKAWLDTCPVRKHGVIIGTRAYAFRTAWEEVRRLVGYRIGDAPDHGWPKASTVWPDDVLRHCYGSYWLAINSDRARLAENMGNSLKTIKMHYRRALRETIAKEFWEIVPAKRDNKILRMETA